MEEDAFTAISCFLTPVMELWRRSSVGAVATAGLELVTSIKDKERLAVTRDDIPAVGGGP